MTSLVRPGIAGLIQLSVLLSLSLSLLLASGCLALSGGDYVSVSRTFFASPEEEVQGIRGERVVLPCEFIVDQVAKPEINVIWQKNKKTLTFNRNFVDDPRLSIAPTDISTKSKFDLQISGLMASDEGLYRCIASYENQFFIKNVTLLVKVPPTIDETDLSSPPLKTLVEGSNYALRCQATGAPQPRIDWYKMVEQPYIEAMNKEKILVGKGPIYEIKNVTRKCAGTFMCIASNDIHPSASKKFKITVNYKPTVALVNEEISQKRGLSTMVMCVITGNPLPEFYWEYRSKRFSSGGSKTCDTPEPAQKHCIHISGLADSRHVVQMDLMINNLTAQDFGVYYCVARSSLGEDMRAAHVLEVHDPRPEVFTRRPLPPPYPGNSPNSGQATEPGDMYNRHATGSTLQGSKGAAAAAGSATSTVSPVTSTISVSLSLTVLLLMAMKF